MVSRIISLFFVCYALAQDIIYEEEDESCQLPSGARGICREASLCPEAFENFPAVKPNICGFQGKSPLVCCSHLTAPVTEAPNNTVNLLDTSPPDVDFFCGDSIPERVFVGGCPVCGIGGEPARFVLVKYSVLVGSREASGPIEWFCTGVLINHLWVLTAAHCRFHRPINVVRLGEHDYNDIYDGARPMTLEVVEEVAYPEFSHPRGYHDLALLRMAETVTFNHLINPVCLPWGDASGKNLINEVVSLTGWGATQFGGQGSSILQEVNVTVFETSVCERSYSNLKDYEIVWPRGIGKDVLCAGDPEGGKDACQGDSGGPVTYLNSAKQYVLAGVVSRGYGCGLREYPGLYANIHYPPYLAWIKRVAFQQ